MRLSCANSPPGSLYGSLKLARDNWHTLRCFWQVYFEGVIICDEIGDLIGVQWITCQVIAYVWPVTGAHFLDIASSDALHSLFSLSIHKAILFPAQVCDAISQKRLVTCCVRYDQYCLK